MKNIQDGSTISKFPFLDALANPTQKLITDSMSPSLDAILIPPLMFCTSNPGLCNELAKFSKDGLSSSAKF